MTDFVTGDALAELRETFANMTPQERELIAVNKDDVVVAFPYQIGIIHDVDEDSKQMKRFIEITMVYHVAENFNEFQKKEMTYEEMMNIG